MELISRKQAISDGLTQYFTGKPCKFGHLSPRNTGSSNCLECWRASAKVDRTDNPEKHKAIRAAEYIRNKDGILAHQKEYRQTNWSEIYAKRKSSPKYKEYMAQYLSDYLKTNHEARAKHLARTRARQARKLQQIPKWVDVAELIQIKQLYMKAAKLTNETGIPHEVDHIVPLAGTNVSGLHCLANLQILTREANRKKWNKYEDA